MPKSSIFLGLSGAVEDPDLHGVSHYGLPLKESRALEEGRAIVDLSHEGLVRVSGPDRLSWLNSITSQRLDNLSPHESVETLILSPTGRIDFALKVVDDGESTWLMVANTRAAELIDFLQKMKFMLRVEITDESLNYGQFGTFAKDWQEVFAEVLEDAVVWVDPWQQVLSGGHQYAEDAEPYDWHLKRVILPLSNLESVKQMHLNQKVEVAGLEALKALEIAARRPSFDEIDDRALPHEFDWLRTAVHLNKGCYRGQETVAKVHNLGHPPRRLVMLHIDSADGETPKAGALIYTAEQPDKPVGRLTRAAQHHDFGIVGLGLLKRKTDESAELLVALASGALASAQQEVIVPASAGAVRDVPRLQRLQ